VLGSDDIDGDASGLDTDAPADDGDVDRTSWLRLGLSAASEVFVASETAETLGCRRATTYRRCSSANSRTAATGWERTQANNCRASSTASTRASISSTVL
jgi:hypothetical protein